MPASVTLTQLIATLFRRWFFSTYVIVFILRLILWRLEKKMAIFWSVWYNFSTNTFFDRWSMFSTYTACKNSNFKLYILEEHHSHTLDDLFLFVLFFQRHISIFHFGLFLFRNHLRKCDRHIYFSFLFFLFLSVSRARKHIFLFSQLRDSNS